MSRRDRWIVLLVVELATCALLAGLLAAIFGSPVTFDALPTRLRATPAAKSALRSTATPEGRSASPPSPTPAANPGQPALTPPALQTEPGPTAPSRLGARVSADASGLRLRHTPGTAGEIIIELAALTPLNIVGRTADNTWVEVITPDGNQGWVAAQYLDVDLELSVVDVTGAAVHAPGTDLPYLSGLTAHSRDIFLAGLRAGKREFAFSMVGDSNTDNPAFLAAFDHGEYNLGPYAHLQDTITYFGGSFSRDSAAAAGGFNTWRVLDPAYADDRCAAGESPLACEYRLHEPSVALILLGTGDQHSWQGFETRYRQIVEFTLAQGIIPVVMTKADDLESVENTAPAGYINAVIARVSREYDVPLLDLRQAVAFLPNRGCLPDGFHYNTPPDGQSAYFTDGYLQYGYNMRNLTALQTLDALRRYVLYRSIP